MGSSSRLVEVLFYIIFKLSTDSYCKITLAQQFYSRYLSYVNANTRIKKVHSITEIVPKRGKISIKKRIGKYDMSTYEDTKYLLT